MSEFDPIQQNYAYSIPIPGKSYIVKTGDTFESIAARAYGDIQEAYKIRTANPGITVLKFRDIINIPVVPEREPIRTDAAERKLANKGFLEPTVIIDGTEIIPYSLTIFRAMNTAADGWSMTIPWSLGENNDLDKKILPFIYSPAQIYIGGELIINGLLYITEPKLSNNGEATVTLTGFSFAKDAVDSHLVPPFEANKVKLEQRAREVIAKLGIRSVFNNDSGGIFDRITGNASETIFKHLDKLAAQRGMMISSTPSGDLLFTRPSQINIGTLKQKDGIVLDWAAKFDGTQRFNTYIAKGQTPLGESEESAIDPKVPRSRFLNFRADETITGNLKKAAEVKRNRAIAKAITLNLKVSQWTAPNGTIWKDNTEIKVISEQLFLKNGFNFIIRSVKLILDAKGRHAELELEPPQAYSDEIIEDPWSA